MWSNWFEEGLNGFVGSLFGEKKEGSSAILDKPSICKVHTLLTLEILLKFVLAKLYMFV